MLCPAAAARHLLGQIRGLVRVGAVVATAVGAVVAGHGRVGEEQHICEGSRATTAPGGIDGWRRVRCC